MDNFAEIKGLLQQNKTEIESLIKQHHQQLGAVFEALDKRLVLMENGLVTVAGDVSQARHNTHQIRNVLQQFIANQELIMAHLGIIDAPLPAQPISVEHVTR